VDDGADLAGAVCGVVGGVGGRLKAVHPTT
jgi:hypothetical protein